MKKIGIIGAGNMGAGIAQKTSQEGLHVVMVDLKPEFVEKGLNSIKEKLDQGGQEGHQVRRPLSEAQKRRI